MLKSILGLFWLIMPKFFRKFVIRFSQQRFAVSVAAVIIDDANRVLLLKHVFRPGSGWGIPGGFMNKGENPEKAVRRELAEEIGLKLENVRIGPPCGEDQSMNSSQGGFSIKPSLLR